MLALITDGCVIRGGEADVQAALRRGGASARVLRLAGTLVCPDAPPATAPTTAPPRSTGAGSAPAARFGLGDDQFVLVAAGRFGMGSETGDADERPVHQVTISRAFYLQKTEVTQAQWQAVMGSNPSFHSSCGASCPVEQVSWDDVQLFVQKLNQATGLNYRLPTEAEWEYAARAGTTGDYGGTGVLDQMGWYWNNSGSTPHPAGQKQANAWGLHDMHGNVWEWVQDWYDAGYYARSLGSDPPGPPTGQYRVLRGGSWFFNAIYARSANRNYDAPVDRGSSIGFRLARTP
jgi:formylglycine-generating enzyme required for sulfatase activity